MADERIEDWVQAYLKQPAWENRNLAAIVHGQRPRWEGPVEVELANLHRVAGPGPKYRYPKDPNQWQVEVSQIADSIQSPLDLPPLIVRVQPDATHLSDGNHRVDALVTRGFDRGWALLWHDRDPSCTGTWSPFAPSLRRFWESRKERGSCARDAFTSATLGRRRPMPSTSRRKSRVGQFGRGHTFFQTEGKLLKANATPIKLH